jgi:predicted RNase H-like HicB family nuclease
MMTKLLEARSELALTVRGYEVIVRTAPDGTLHVTCPDLPQLSFTSPTISEAIARTKDAINDILTGRERGYLPKGAA